MGPSSTSKLRRGFHWHTATCHLSTQSVFLGWDWLECTNYLWWKNIWYQRPILMVQLFPFVLSSFRWSGRSLYFPTWSDFCHDETVVGKLTLSNNRNIKLSRIVCSALMRNAQRRQIFIQGQRIRAIGRRIKVPVPSHQTHRWRNKSIPPLLTDHIESISRLLQAEYATVAPSAWRTRNTHILLLNTNPGQRPPIALSLIHEPPAIRAQAPEHLGRNTLSGAKHLIGRSRDRKSDALSADLAEARGVLHRQSEAKDPTETVDWYVGAVEDEGRREFYQDSVLQSRRWVLPVYWLVRDSWD